VTRARVGGLALLLGLAAGDLWAQAQLAVEWRLPREGLAFGDTLAVDVLRRWPDGATPEPFDATALAPLLVQLAAVEAVDPQTERRHYRATVFAAGTIRLAPLVLRARKPDGSVVEARCEPPPLVVRSGLADPAGDVEWPDVFAAPPRGRLRPWLLAAAALLLGGLFWWRVRTRDEPRALPPAPAPDPAVAALAALRALVVPAHDAAPEVATRFCVELAALVRQHAGRGLAVPAATRTSEQLLAAARGGADALRACLGHCDAVKFAAARPAAAAHAAARQAAITFVQTERA